LNLLISLRRLGEADFDFVYECDALKLFRKRK
jgi:hypothetical protein